MMTTRADEFPEYCPVTNMAKGYAAAVDALRQQLGEARVTRPGLSGADFLAEKVTAYQATEGR